MQTILGMEQRTTAWLFFGETFLMGLLSLGLGIPLGSLLSQFITTMLLSSYGQSFQLSWALFPDTAALTLLFFSLSFFVVGLFNVRSIQKLHVIDMLQARRKNEDSLKKSRWMPVVTILYLAALAGIAAMNLWYASLYYDSRLPLLARIFYVSNAVLPLAALSPSVGLSPGPAPHQPFLHRPGPVDGPDLLPAHFSGEPALLPALFSCLPVFLPLYGDVSVQPPAVRLEGQVPRP